MGPWTDVCVPTVPSQDLGPLKTAVLSIAVPPSGRENSQVKQVTGEII